MQKHSQRSLPKMKIDVVHVFLSLFIYFERQREQHEQGRGRERWGERIPSRLHAVSAGCSVGLELMTHEIMTWAKIKSWMPNELNHPGAPNLGYFQCTMVFIRCNPIISQKRFVYIISFLILFQLLDVLGYMIEIKHRAIYENIFYL